MPTIQDHLNAIIDHAQAALAIANGQPAPPVVPPVTPPPVVTPTLGAPPMPTTVDEYRRSAGAWGAWYNNLPLKQELENVREHSAVQGYRTLLANAQRALDQSPEGLLWAQYEARAATLVP